MTLDLTRQKLDWLRGLKGIRERRLQECMGKKQWPADDLTRKQEDIAIIDLFISDYERVLERQRAAFEAA